MVADPSAISRQSVGDQLGSDRRPIGDRSPTGCRLYLECLFKAPVTHSLQPVGDLLATKISGGCREVAGWLQGIRRLVADWLQKVAGRFWLLQVKPLCDQIDRRKVLGGRRPVAAVANNPDTVFSRRLIADQSPIGCRPISKKLQSFCNQEQTLKIQSPTDRQLVADRSPTDHRLTADWSPTGRQPLSDYTTL